MLDPAGTPSVCASKGLEPYATTTISSPAHAGRKARKMSRSERGTPAPGAEWWGKRPLASKVSKGSRYTKWWKRQLHKAERREGRDDL